MGSLVEGVNGQIELLQDRIRITRRGFLAFGAHPWAGDKEILLSEITAIKFKRASLMASGFIQFLYPGGQEAKGFHRTVADENTVMFWPRHQKEFAELREAIEQKRQQIKTTAASLDELEILKKLAELHRSGVLSDDEFDAKKRAILEH